MMRRVSFRCQGLSLVNIGGIPLTGTDAAMLAGTSRRSQ